MLLHNREIACGGQFNHKASSSKSAFFGCRNPEEGAFPSSIRSVDGKCPTMYRLWKVKFLSPSKITKGSLAQCLRLRSITKLNSIRKGTKELILPSNIQPIDEKSLTEILGLESITFDGESSIDKSVCCLPSRPQRRDVERISNSAFNNSSSLSIGENTFIDCIELSKLEYQSDALAVAMFLLPPEATLRSLSKTIYQRIGFLQLRSREIRNDRYLDESSQLLNRMPDWVLKRLQ